jgi:putative MATE family efflux protein
VWRLGLPVILTNLLMTLVNVVDVFMVGRLGPIEIAAVGMGQTIRMLVLITVLSVTAGSMALAAQAKGARDPQRLSFVARQSLSLTVLLGLVMSVLGFIGAEPLLTFLNSGGDPEVVVIGTAYLRILFLGTVFLNLNFVISSLMQGAGDTLTPLYLVGGVNALNVGLNYALIFGLGPIPAMGVSGAAIGTISSRLVGGVVGMIILYSGKNVVRLLAGSFRPDWSMFRDLLGIGVPSGLQGIFRNTGQLLVLRIISSTAAGTYGITALAIGFQIASLSFMPGLAMSIAATSLVGQALGAWQVKEAHLRGTVAIVLGIVVMSSIAVPLIVFARQLVLLFEPSAHPTVVAAGTSYLRIVSIAQPILAIAMVTNGTLRGAGDTRPGLIGTFVGRWLIVVPLAYLLALTLDIGVVGVWWALVAGTVFQAGYVLFRWQSRRWVRIALHKTEIYRSHLHALNESVREQYLSEVRSRLMAQPLASEHVTPDGVTYQMEEGDVSVRFSGGHYLVTGGLPAAPQAEKSSGAATLTLEPRTDTVSC